MANVGDRIRLSTGKGADREGVVVAVTGAMVRVRWASNEETSVVPAPGTMTVLAPPRTRRRTPANPPAKKTAAAPAATRKASAAKAAPATKKAAATTKATKATKQTKKAPAAKRGSR